MVHDGKKIMAPKKDGQMTMDAFFKPKNTFKKSHTVDNDEGNVGKQNEEEADKKNDRDTDTAALNIGNEKKPKPIKRRVVVDDEDDQEDTGTDHKDQDHVREPGAKKQRIDENTARENADGKPYQHQENDPALLDMDAMKQVYEPVGTAMDKKKEKSGITNGKKAKKEKLTAKDTSNDGKSAVKEMPMDLEIPQAKSSSPKKETGLSLKNSKRAKDQDQDQKDSDDHDDDEVRVDGSDGGDSSAEDEEDSEDETKQKPKRIKDATTTKAKSKSKRGDEDDHTTLDEFLGISSAADKEMEEMKSLVTWKKGEPVPYLFLANVFSKVEAETSRLKIASILIAAFRWVLRTSPEDLLPVIYLSTNKLAPAHEGLELGVGEATIIKALSQATGKSATDIKKLVEKSGDLGDVAAKSRSTQRTLVPPKPITIRSLFKDMKAIATASGKDATYQRTSRITSLLGASKSMEAKYVTRSMQGKLRIHLAERTVVPALAHAYVLEHTMPKYPGDKVLQEAALLLSSTYSELPVWEQIIPVLNECGSVDGRLSEKCKLTPGVPVGPMLAKPTKGIQEVITRFEGVPFTCEWKYDGERAQIHRLRDGTIRIYSRNAENHTQKYPDIVASVSNALNEECGGYDFVLDSEAVAFNFEKGVMLPFQALQRRARKDVKLEDIEVQVILFAFDLLYCNGKSLIREPFEKRREILHSVFKPVEGKFRFAESRDGRELEEIDQFLNESISAGCEGLMVKQLQGPQSTYEPANRSTNWLKVKKDYLDNVGDSLDLVPIGGYYGKGKRTGTFGAYLLACYNRDSDEYQTICKLGTGFSDEQLARFSQFFSEENRTLKQAKSYYRYNNLPANQIPDVWFEPCCVWEIKCADMSLSPVHSAGIGLIEENRGVALRFPRLLRERDDKNPEDATDSEQVVDMYNRQVLL